MEDRRSTGPRRPLERRALTSREGGSRRRVSSGGMTGSPWLPLKSQSGAKGRSGGRRCRYELKVKQRAG